MEILRAREDSKTLSCRWVAKSASHVFIENQGIKSFAKVIIDQQKFSTDAAAQIVEWDSSGWHFCEDVNSNGELTMQYIFVLDALNFCFWPSEDFEYDTLAIALKIALTNDRTAFDAEKLSNLTEDKFLSWFANPKSLPPNIHERLLRLQELGEALASNFDGKAINLVKASNNSAAELVKLVLMHLPGFRDTAIYNGRLVHLYKRAQILVADLWGAFKRPQDPQHPCYFRDIDQLTMFADYRVPQILRQVGILRYSESLQKDIDSLREIPFGSPQEVEIRACSIVAVEELYEELVRLSGDESEGEQSGDWGRKYVLELDWLLWQWAEQRCKDVDMPPFHRTNTIYY